MYIYGNPVWGSIEGDINDQLDLIALLGVSYTDEMAQDAVGSILNSSLAYDDGTPAIGINLSNANTWAATQTFPRIDVDLITLDSFTISTNTTNQNLRLIPNGTGIVEIDGTLMPKTGPTSGQYLIGGSGGTCSWVTVTPASKINSEILGVTDQAIVRWDGTSGNNVDDSLVLISDAGVISGFTGFIGTNISYNSTDAHLSVGTDPTNNDITVNGFTYSSALISKENDFNNLAQFTLLRSGSTLAAAGVPIFMARSRGSVASKTATTIGDNIGSFSFAAHDGTDFNLAAQLAIGVSGTVSNDITPASFNFAVQPDAGGAVQSRMALQSGSESVFNEPGNDHDYRFESDTNTHLLFLDAGAASGAGRIGIKQASPASDLDIAGSFQCDSISNDSGLAHGSYTPTLTNVTNIAASTAYPCQYMRVGNTVTVSGKIDIDVTTGSAAMEVGISLPIASNFGNDYECSGSAYASTVARDGFAISADPTNNRARAVGFIVSATNQSFFFTFSYEVKA